MIAIVDRWIKYKIFTWWWFFEENFSKEKIIESSVWPKKEVAHQQQLRTKRTVLLCSVNYRLKKMDEASMRKTQLQRQLSASISSLKQSWAGSACSTQWARISLITKNL